MEEPLVDYEVDVRNALIEVLRGRDIFWKSADLTLWAQDNLSARVHAGRDAWQIIEARLSDERLESPFLLAAGWLLKFRGAEPRDIERDTGLSIDKVLPIVKQRAVPIEGAGVRRLIAAACLLQDEDWVEKNRRSSRKPSSVFQPSDNGYTPAEKLVGVALMRAAEEWFDADGGPGEDQGVGQGVATSADTPSPELEPESEPVADAATETPSSADGGEASNSPGVTVSPADRLVRTTSVWRRWQSPQVRIWSLLAVATVVFSVGALIVSQPWRTAAPEQSSTRPQASIAPPEELTMTTSVAPINWGPKERPEISAQSRSPGAVLNSIFNNPSYGDERRFMKVKLSTDPDSSYTDKLPIEAGKVYTAQIYVHNDAATGSESSAAKIVRLSLQMPGVIKGWVNVGGILSSSNATPSSLWDGFTLLTPAPDMQVALRYVADSAIFTTASGSVFSLGDALFSDSGVLLGCHQLDGAIQADDGCGGYVTFDFRVDRPDFAVVVAARVKGSGGAYSPNVTARPGDVLEVNVSYQNTGTAQQDKVSLRIPELPSGLRYVAGSTKVANSATDGKSVSTIDGIATTGMNLGSFQPKGNCFVTFDVLVEPGIQLPDGSPAWISSSEFALATTSAGTKPAGLTVTVVPK